MTDQKITIHQNVLLLCWKHNEVPALRLQRRRFRKILIKMRFIYLSKIPLFQKQIISGVVFGVSIWALVDDQAGFHDLMDLSEADSDLSILTSGPWILIVSSGLVMIVTFLGCYGALKVLLRKLSQFFW